MISSPVTRLFAFSFLTSVTYVTIRTVGVSAFLARIGGESLPLLILLSALSAITASTLSLWAMRRLRLHRVIACSWLLIGGATMSLAAAANAYPQSFWILGCIYVLAEIRGCLNTAHLATLAGDAFAEEESKRPFALVSSGAPVAGIVGGLILTLEASEARLPFVLGALAAVDLLVAFWSLRVAPQRQIQAAPLRVGKQAEPPRPTEDERSGNAEQSWPRYRVWLTVLVATQIVVLTLVGYEWKLTVSSYFHSDEVRMVAYFGLFYAVSDLIIILLQWFVAGKLLDRFGIGLGLMGYPLSLSLIGVALFFGYSPLWLLIWLTVGKGLHVFRRSFHDPALVAAYTILNPRLRSETIMSVKGIVKPLAEAATAISLLLLTAAIHPIFINVFWLSALPIWFVIARRITRHFRRQRSPK